MRVLIAHVRYRQPGGEDTVFEAEAELLRRAGHEVSTLDLSSAEFDRLRPLTRLAIATHYADHNYGRQLMEAAIERFQPDVVHFHNLYPLLGTGAIAEAQRDGCATVQTVHNYRLSCLNGLHFHLRKGRVCEDCSPGSFAPGIRDGCYRDSRLQSALVARATTAQWQAFLYAGRPSLLIALTGFMKEKLVAYGANPERIVVKPNSVKGQPGLTVVGRRDALFVGRLSREKGVLELIRSWPADAPHLTVAGDGPLAEEARQAAGENVTLTGFLTQTQLKCHLWSAAVLVVPSLWYEGLPLVALEALAGATPVVAFRGGGLEEILERIDARCVVPAGDFAALCDAAMRLAAADDWSSLSERCRREQERHFSSEVNVAALQTIYDRALGAMSSSGSLSSLRY